jgi:hypothetical protein
MSLLTFRGVTTHICFTRSGGGISAKKSWQRRFPASEKVVEPDAHDHREYEDDRGKAAARRRHETRPRTVAAEPPPDPEDDRAENEPSVDVGTRGKMKFRLEKRRRTLRDRTMEYRIERDRPDHHEEKTRVPRAHEIEKTDDFPRFRHSRNAESDREEKTRREARNPPLHRRPPRTWRVTKTVTNPASMKVAVATSERGESLLTPQMP